MSPLILLGLVAITWLVPSSADVKHVLEGSAHPPPCYPNEPQLNHASHVNGQFGREPNFAATNNVPGSVAFWWADDNSPFKHAYDYFKKCSLKGNCVPPVAPGFQVPETGCGPNGCGATNSIESKEQPVPLAFGPIDINKNPFLNGQIQGVSTACSGSACQRGAGIDISRNPFLNNAAAYSGAGQAVTGSNGFLGVQPSVPFNSNKPQPFATAHPSQAAAGFGSQQFAGQSPTQEGTNGFPSNYPVSGGQGFGFAANVQTNKGNFENCKEAGRFCVAPELCSNGIIKNIGQGVLNLRNSVDYCEVGKEVCCKLPQASGVTTSYAGFPTKNAAPANAPAVSSQFYSGYSNLSYITTGKDSSPGSTIKFTGAAGLSPGSIKVVSNEEPVPNPLISSLGETGSSLIKTGTANSIKVIRNTSPQTNSVFSSTIDYSNDKLDQLSFASTTQGPQYLPPVSSPKPPSSSYGDLLPPISTYQPSVPTTSRPLVTKPVIPGVSVVTPFTPPFEPEQKQPQQIVPSYTPIPQIVTPRPSFPTGTYLPPSPTPFVTKPSTPFIQQSTNSYIPPVYKPQPTVLTTYRNTYPTPTPFTTVTQKPQFSSQPTSGYQYPQPSPPFEYSTASTPPRPIIGQNSNLNNQYITPKPITTSNQYIPPSISTPGYKYPQPTPPFQYPTVTSPSTPRPYTVPTINNNYFTTKQTQPPFITYTSPRPTPQVTYRPTSGYSYPTPTPSFSLPTTNNQYLPPVPTPPPYQPPYQPPLETGASSNTSYFVKYPQTPGIPIEPVGCAAALKCVQEIYCTAAGFISPTPVVLSKDQEYLKVPTTDCADKETGVVGKCCRDPNYIDPWPSANLINGFDNGQYREDSSLGQYFPQKQRPIRSEVTSPFQNVVPYNGFQAPVAAPSLFVAEVSKKSYKDNTCGIRHLNTIPRGPGPIDAAFAEIPWQAMVLRDTNRSLLCGGVIVKQNAILTAAHCVEGLDTRDVLIKGGEWKLGIDEEPLPFQIVKVAAIIRHPAYQPGVLKNDLALLMLDDKLRFANNIAPICLDNSQPSGQCIVTGWGKKVLQVHLRGAIMRSVDVNMLDKNTCTDKITNDYQHILPHYDDNTMCAFSKDDQCYVDYGSALACTNGDGQYNLAGIFSWDTGCKDSQQIGGYIPPDVQWIESTCSQPLTYLKQLDRQYYNQ